MSAPWASGSACAWSGVIRYAWQFLRPAGSCSTSSRSDCRPTAIGHRAIHRLPPAEVARLAWAVLQQCRLVFDFNREHRGVLELGLDGQISNWAIAGFDPSAGALPPAVDLIYLDTSTPLMRRDGREQLDPELLMRSAPSFTLWLLRRAFLPEVMTRYYDFRRVAMDLVANFYKEGRPELVPELVETVNRFFVDELREAGFKPLTVVGDRGLLSFRCPDLARVPGVCASSIAGCRACAAGSIPIPCPTRFAR